jgi:hypothetical protein
MYYLNQDIEIEQNAISYKEHKNRIDKLHSKIFLDVANMFDNVSNLTKRKLNDNSYQITAPNFTTYLYKDNDEFKMAFQCFSVKRMKYEYGIPLIETRAIIDLMKDFLRIQQRYNYLLILNKLCDIQDIRFEILKYLMPVEKPRLQQLRNYC